MIKAAVFDLDGTICNTIDDLAESTNYALSVCGYPLHTVDEYKYFVGNGIPKLIYRAVPADKRSAPELERAKNIMLRHYATHYADKSRPYGGILELLDYLKKSNIRLAVCTNKADNMAKVIVEKLFADTFEIVIGQSQARPLKPNASSVNEIMQKLEVSAGETVFIGDSEVDMQTAVNAGTHSIGAAWGFRTVEELNKNGAEYIAYTPLEVIKLIKNM